MAPPSISDSTSTAVPGSDQDLRERIRRFYAFWLAKTDAAIGQNVSPTNGIDIDRISDDEAKHYNATVAYNVSGFAVRGFYRGHESAHSFAGERQFIVLNHELPPAFARSQAANNKTSLREHEKRNDLWIAAEKEQMHPIWTIPNGPRHILPKFYCMPRILPLQPSCVSTNGGPPDMKEWVKACDKPFKLETDNRYSTIVDEWTQLSNTPTLPEERHKGSPSSPLISLFRLDVVDGTVRITSVLVIFRIVEEVNTYRPWRKADAAPRVASGAYNLRSTRILTVDSLLDHSHSLTHRQRKVYQQDFAHRPL